MTTGYTIRKNEYYDSVFLMRIARTINEEPGVEQCAVLMATEPNKLLLADLGIQGAELERATPNDLVVAVLAHSPESIEHILAGLDARLQSLAGPVRPVSYQSIEEAAVAYPESNLVVISVPGEYAAREARKALEQGKHVFLFSNNVSLEEEIELKKSAERLGRLVMGPDCGTSILNGVGIGFANLVRRGPVGVVGPSGTGLQEFTSLVHQAGSGISHAIGAGSRDLTDAIGGITTLMGLEALEADPGTSVIAIVAKPAQPKTLQRLLAKIRSCTKPVIGCFLGLDQHLAGGGEHFTQAQDIDEAVRLAVGATGIQEQPGASRADLDSLIEKETKAWAPQQRYLRGLFAGGTFCYQSQQVFWQASLPVYSNSPLDKRYRLENPQMSLEHSLVDLGDDIFTRGKPHPMIDATERSKRILAESMDPEVAILLLDFILGQMAAKDPSGDLIGAIRSAQQATAHRGGHLTMVASICGTDQDPQGLFQQRTILEQAGVLLFPSNVQAARFCAQAIQAARGGKHGR